jgi:hypothetical protein
MQVKLTVFTCDVVDCDAAVTLKRDGGPLYPPGWTIVGAPGEEEAYVCETHAASLSIKPRPTDPTMKRALEAIG